MNMREEEAEEEDDDDDDDDKYTSGGENGDNWDADNQGLVEITATQTDKSGLRSRPQPKIIDSI